MKNSIKNIVVVAIVSILTLSFTNTKEEKKEIKTESSKVVWKGYKVTGSHEGIINIKSGHLIFNNNKLTGGKFIIDMTSMACTDLEGEYKGKLEGHLKSDDFFGVENFPTATLVFTKVKASEKHAYQVTGNITIKGKTESITLNISVNGNKANAALKIDRTKFGVKYGSASFFDGLKDKAIHDDFDLVADLEF